MEEESVTESEWSSESSSESDWLSENEGKKGQQRGKRRMKTQSCKEREQTETASLKKRGTKRKACSNSSQSLGQQINNKAILPVTCGDKKGSLYLEKYDNSENCILSEGQWFKPTDFEKFGGRETSKKWKTSILLYGVPLQKYIEDGHLSCPVFRKSRPHDEQNNTPGCPPVARRLRGMKNNSPESSCVAGSIRRTKSKKKVFPCSSESEIRDSGHNGQNNDNNDDVIDLTEFEGPTLPVTCGSVSGILHKYRFAAGHCGKCIRTEDFWLTPEHFITLSKGDGTWRKDIVSHGIPLGKLIMKRVLEPHTINCECDVCQELDQYANDDVCYECHSEGDLVCCDECPRAFHPHCHLPTVEDDSGSKWSCTFCMMKNIGVSNQTTQQDVLNSPVSQNKLHCQYLLLYLLHEGTADSYIRVSANENTGGTNDVKLKLQNDDYQTVGEFVTDIEHIIQHPTSNRDNDFSRMERLFKREFETIFKIV